MANRDWDGMIDEVEYCARELVAAREWGMNTKNLDKCLSQCRTTFREAIAEEGKRFDAAVCILKELRDGLDPAYFDKSIKAIDDFISGIDPYSGVYEEKAELERKLAEAEKDIRNLEQSSAWYDPYNEIYTCPFCESTSEESPEYIKHEAHCSYGHLRARVEREGNQCQKN